MQPSLPLICVACCRAGICWCSPLWCCCYGPKLLAVGALLEDAQALTRAHGGTRRLVLGAFWESLFSTLMAPIVMLQHSWFVISAL
jgi:membrane glycosyltransferase